MPKDEAVFFQAFRQVVGEEYLLSKNIGKKISVDDVNINKNYINSRFPDNVNEMLSTILSIMKSTGDIPSGSLSHNIDGLLVNHPQYGTRIVEFDEEQHFNPYRLLSLKELSKISIAPYIEHLIENCKDIGYFKRMLKKHRLKIYLEFVPNDIKDFHRIVEENANQNNGYIKHKKGFEFWGGRIAQRAFYDTLRDVAHFSPINIGFKYPFRFTKYEFEQKMSKTFDSLTSDEIHHYIEKRLIGLN